MYAESHILKNRTEILLLIKIIISIDGHVALDGIYEYISQHSILYFLYSYQMLQQVLALLLEE